MRWSNENAYDAAFTDASARYGVPFGLLKGVAGTESAFNPDAIRGETAIGDASVGLMQLLLRTAQGMGFDGTADDLTDPSTNIALGAKYLRRLYAALQDWPSVISAYNGGIRAQFGFGKRATAPGTVCLARDADGNCIRTYSYQAGEFGNQPYVDTVLQNAAYFGWTPPTAVTTTSAAGPGLLAVIVLLGLGLLWAAARAARAVRGA